jgi:hypothetical protein
MLAQETKIVVGSYSKDASTGGTLTSYYVNMGKYDHITALVNFQTTGTVTAALYKATSSTGAGAAIAGGFHYWYNKDTTGSDTLTEGGTSTSAVTVSTGSAVEGLVVLEMDSADMQSSVADYDFAAVRITSTTGVVYGTEYILSNARYADAVPPTARS